MYVFILELVCMQYDLNKSYFVHYMYIHLCIEFAVYVHIE